MQRSENDGSLNPMREEIRVLKMKVDKEKGRRKVLEERVDVIMDFLDGQSHFNTRKLADGTKPLAVKFRKMPLPREAEDEQ
jgi:hypothetical protein